VRLSAWDVAGASVEETLRTRAAVSLERLGRLGQLGSLPLVVEAARDGGDASAAVLAHARERESLGFASGEVAAELLGLGRVLERRGERRAREALDRALLVLFESVTGDLAERARRDPLTGLLNHQAFHAAVAAETARARRYRGRVALVAFDLDGFKRTNDTEGHPEGDRLLRAFAAALARTIRESDRAGRLGGDEFAALLLQADSRAVHAFLDRLTRRLPRGVSTSAGAAFLNEVAGPPEQLFELADRRLYADKAARAAAA
jgi:diguanylate cyclase (GGDEF)-like protein